MLNNQLSWKFFRVIFCLFLLVSCASAAAEPTPEPTPDPALADPINDWAVQPGFSIAVDTAGYHFPTAIAFVPQPGAGPKDPLYFVTELRGKIKVITNDRSVYTFADDVAAFEPLQELPHEHAQNGLSGICLAPEHGYVFVTLAYQKNFVLHNKIVRFKTTPDTFALEPESQIEFTEVFESNTTAYAHQIGQCQVIDDQLYVGVGDAWHVDEAQQLDSTNGKILRMSLDGKPLPDNPYYLDQSISRPANYVWALGFRNPFGLAFAHNRLFTAENGLAVDRFVEIKKGKNYLWNGSDWSIGTNADAIFYPSIAPVQVDYCDDGSPIFPEAYTNHFYFASFGDPTRPAGVIMLKYDFAEDELGTVPTEFVSYRGQSGGQGNSVIGLALGPDGLYFSPLWPGPDGTGHIFRVSYDPLHEHALTLTELDPFLLMESKGCFGCHQLGGEGGTLGPSLDRDPMVARLEERLTSSEYQRMIAELNQNSSEPLVSYVHERDQVLAEEGTDQVVTWIRYRLIEPRFDDPLAQMPNLNISEEEAVVITENLVSEKTEELGDPLSNSLYRIRGMIDRRLQPVRYRHLMLAFVLGFFSAIFGGFVFNRVIRWRRKPS
ncbi:MAG: PQQ-dependent sugar dehydrogenase [Ardenticatenaceae bacterium]|nr:PQQ-dependent sugar dehydrogenase [Ardenticatenaceae bacterium]